MAVIIYENDSRLNWIDAAWDSGITYNVHDALQHNGTSYRCIVQHSNKEPGVAVDWATHWAVIAEKGEQGADGTAVNLDDLGDVDLTTTPPTDQQALIFDDASNVWLPGSVAAGGGAAAFVGAKARKAAQQSIPASTWTSLTLTSEDFDTDGFHDTATNPSRFTVPAGKNGKYVVHGTVGFDGSTTGFRFLRILKNGVTEQAIVANLPVGPSGDAALAVSTIVALAVGDYVEIQAWHNHSAALNTNVDNNRTTLAVGFIGT